MGWEDGKTSQEGILDLATVRCSRRRKDVGTAGALADSGTCVRGRGGAEGGGVGHVTELKHCREFSGEAPPPPVTCSGAVTDMSLVNVTNNCVIKLCHVLVPAFIK